MYRRTTLQGVLRALRLLKKEGESNERLLRLLRTSGMVMYMQERRKIMAYKYDLYSSATMSNQELLNALMAKEIAPRVIVGTGYKNGRQIAIDYLKEEIANEREGK
jgi:hypothetical protein